MIRVDLHTHSNYSKDSRSSLDDIIKAVPTSRVHAIALTDHNVFEGAVELQKRAPFVVIAGEEVKTDAGEIIGLFLREWIPPGLSPEETIGRIREQKGIVYVPHPFDQVRKSRITEEQLDKIRGDIDILEAFNGRNLLPRYNRKAVAYAARYGLATGAGSDAHTCREYGAGYVEVAPFDGPETFLQALKNGQWFGRLSSPLVHGRTRLDVLRKKLESRGAGDND
jgi:predicted metal-dependent phosphoesterase TrpH